MPTTRSRGLSTADLDTLRTAVEAGRKPKVQFTSTAGQVAGQIGQVVRFDDPSADEWVVVRFGRDELPFAPADLQLAPKATPRAKAAPKPSGAKAAAVVGDTAPGNTAPGDTGPGNMGPGVAGPGARSGSTEVPAAVAAAAERTRAASAAAPASVAAAASTATRPVTAAATPAEAAASVKPAARSGATRTTGQSAEPTAATPAEAASAAKPANAGAAAAKSRPAARKGSAKRAPDLTVTLAHHEGYWTVSASRGARMLVKPTSVRAADALKMVGQLESPAVADAVEEIVSAARAEAEEQAERLRQQLAEVEAALADLADPE